MLLLRRRGGERHHEFRKLLEAHLPVTCERRTRERIQRERVRRLARTVDVSHENHLVDLVVGGGFAQAFQHVRNLCGAHIAAAREG